MTREQYEEMTKDDLRSIADEKGVKLLALDSKGTMIDKILGIEAPKAKAEVQEPPLGALYTLQGEKVSGKKYELEIFDSPTDHSDVDLIINGHNLRIRRGQKVVVDEAYIALLRNAVIETVIEDPDTGKRYPSRIPAYPHTAVAI